MNILAICAALNNSYFAIEYNNKIISKILKSDENYHSLYLINEIKNTLKDNNLNLRDFDIFTVNCGPGSFTGIRVAMSIAKVMAGELNKPLVGLNSSQILLRAYKKEYLVMDARRDMYFIAVKDDIKLELKDKVIEEYKDKEVVCDKNSKPYFKNSICYEDETKQVDLGRVMLELAKEIYNNSKDKSAFNYKLIEPNYIQTPPVFN